MNPRVQSVAPEPDYRLHLTFTNGETGIYDCRSILSFGVFEKLRNREYFQQVRVENGTVIWPHEQDICPDTLYQDAKKAVKA